MSSFLPDGYRFTPAREDDAAEAARVMSALDAEFGTDEVVTEEDVRSSWRDLGADGRAWFVVDAAGVPAAYAAVFMRADEATLDGYVLPQEFGRGIGSALAELGEAHARSLAATSVVTGTLGRDDRATALFESRGWRRERVFLRMSIDLRGDERPPEPPAGLSVRTVREGDERAFHEAKEEAFADHWNFRSEPFDEFRRRVIESEEFDPALWWLVEDGDEFAAVIRCIGNRFGSGWVSSLGVRPAWRRRGLGEVLLRTAFAEFARRGERRVGLGVDAENTTGATRLYERVGMKVAFHANVFRKMLP
jgi:mycothiol synthase